MLCESAGGLIMRQFFWGIWILIKILASLLLVSLALVMVVGASKGSEVNFTGLGLAAVLLLPVAMLWFPPGGRLYKQRMAWLKQFEAMGNTMRQMAVGEPPSIEKLDQIKERLSDIGPFPGYPRSKEEQDRYAAAFAVLYREHDEAMQRLQSAGSDRNELSKAFEQAKRLEDKISALQEERRRAWQRKLVLQLVSTLLGLFLMTGLLWYLPTFLRFIVD
jgi:hypothetical protein